MSDVELSIEDKIKIASGFLLSSPPGEVNDVFNDIRGIINDDAALQQHITPALEEYNIDQLQTVTLPETEHAVIISKYNRVDADHFVDPRSKQIFKFDHLRQTATDPQPHTVEEAQEELRLAVDDAVQKYVAEHYPEGASLVHIDEQQLTLLVVSNKYSPSNFWNGRWRSVWTVDLAARQVKGTAKVLVHYYEQGNIQLNSDRSFELECDANPAEDPAAFARVLLRTIGRAEKEYHLAINDTYGQLSESIFKGLRRNLPVTRSKIDWDKILNYKLPTELSK
ncbi:F-actin-capping protein subunit alpha [Tieghemiomyces parasiticus]|uniref:F-actin-capping protein subunit alpha n=1 Tax=Tieghemiomyces parasiticus TaxID=78921 RepID=A0A9W8A5W6_9FUNG|nr:F-actin-capping protein subunit alpha [Tieghemiomyces parasiticus]